MPSSIVRAFATKTGKSEKEVESKWEEAKQAVRKHTTEKDEKFYPSVVAVLKNMLGLNEDAPVAVGAATTTSGIAVVPKRLGAPVKRLEYDGNLNGYPYFEIKEVGDYMQIARDKRANKKMSFKDKRVHQHFKEKGGPVLLKHQNNTIKITKHDIYS